MKNPHGNTVKIAEFKAHLSHYLREVRAGHVLMVMDRSTPVAFVTPADKKRGDILIVRKANRKWSDIKLPPPLKTSVDAVKLLLEDRESGR
jgi:prevent-host-death family protein